jgi:DNA-directed RNA polymerase specialized sigma subunit
MLQKFNLIPRMQRTLNAELIEIFENKKNLYNSIQTSKLGSKPRTNKVADPTYTAAEKLVDFYSKRALEIVEEIEALTYQRDIVNRSTQYLTPEQYRVIELRYIKGYKMKKIPGCIGYSLAQVYNIHNAAIKAISEQIELNKH